MTDRQQPTKALVLGGGGTTGIAWELGILMGLYEQGIDVTDAGLVVGTSAGSVVGAQITTGKPLEDFYALQLRPLEETKEQVVQFDLAAFFQLMKAGAGAPDTQTARARMGAVALAAKTMPEEERLEIISARLPEKEWPKNRRLLISAVDTHTGELVVFDQASAVPLVPAVAASCAVPAVYPPITIGSRRYMDGGMRSATNADLAKGTERVLILSTGTIDPSAFGIQDTIPIVTFAEELATLEQAGAKILVITPDEASTAARGPNPLDASRRPGSATAGREQGESLAEQVKRFWGE